ncbi:MAG: oligosaccharide flippase family protein, partial [Bacteroidota bacterium]
FKQLATGMEKFRPLLYMSVSSNVVRSLALVILALSGHLSHNLVIFIFVGGDLFELLCCILIIQYIIKVPVSIKWNKREYISLFKESLPQMGVSIFTSVIARFDWIIIGLFTSTVILANYSFAYKIFEMATLPMLVVAPVLIPRFTKLFHPGSPLPNSNRIDELFALLRIEMIVSSFVALILNIIWVPVIDLASNGKYGSINSTTIMVLSASMPFLYFNNFLWTVNFAKGRLKMIFFVFAASFLINVIANIFLTPVYKAEGAAAAYLLTIVGQSVLYILNTELKGLLRNSGPVLLCPLCAIISGIAASYSFGNSWLQLASACILFLLLLIITRQLLLSDRLLFKRFTGL